jgi:predicted PhzF superfamily epimerase YddE/YHI9/ribosomal protein S18 acetylase RimI-like enzyme
MSENPAHVAAGESILNRIEFRTVRPTDIPACAELEKAGYPESEGASKTTLQYRQHHAARYFRCAVVRENNDDINISSSSTVNNNNNNTLVKSSNVINNDDDADIVVGFVCSTRCKTFTEASLHAHVSDGAILAIHSVVVQESYRHLGIATAMLRNYVSVIQERARKDGIEKIALMAKSKMLTFYIHCGFQVVRPSAIVHGADPWYDLELDLRQQKDETNGVPCFIVDAFVDPDQTGSGNPAAIVLLKEGTPMDDEVTGTYMQAVAAEFNLSETAFLVPMTDVPKTTETKELHYSIRFYTPTKQVPLCGHATLAAASILYQTIYLKHKTPVIFHAPETILRCEHAGSMGDRAARITMHFPCHAAEEIIQEDDIDPLHKMLEAALHIDSNSIEYMGHSPGTGDLLIEIKYVYIELLDLFMDSFIRVSMFSQIVNCIGALRYEDFLEIGYEGINYDAFMKYDGYERGVILCCTPPPLPANLPNEESSLKEESISIDFYTRFFGPKAGINEDPVTGSAHCVLTPYYSDKLEKRQVNSMQMSRRGGVIECNHVDKTHVELTGTAVTRVSGTLWFHDKFFL